MSILSAHRGTINLTPEMAKRVNAFVVLCKEKKLNILITETWRTKARQLWLWAKGRVISRALEVEYLGYDDPAIYSKPHERQVTWTLKSKHIEGKAIDICFKVGTGITYNGDWDAVYDVAESVGMVSLYRKYGIDKPHLEFNENWKPVDTIKKEKLEGLERQYKIEADRANHAVRKLNDITKLLSSEKGIVYVGHRLTRG